MDSLTGTKKRTKLFLTLSASYDVTRDSSIVLDCPTEHQRPYLFLLHDGFTVNCLKLLGIQIDVQKINELRLGDRLKGTFCK
jgi:hypothetical protein